MSNIINEEEINYTDDDVTDEESQEKDNTDNFEDSNVMDDE